MAGDLTLSEKVSDSTLAENRARRADEPRQVSPLWNSSKPPMLYLNSLSSNRSLRQRVTAQQSFTGSVYQMTLERRIGQALA